MHPRSLRLLFLERALLIFALVGASAAKLVSGHDAQYLMGAEIYYSAAVFEVIVAALLVKGLIVIPSILCMMMAVGGLVVSWTTDRPCGCLGTVFALSATLHAMISASFGLLAALMLWQASTSATR